MNYQGEDENRGVKNIMILLTFFSVMILTAIYMVYSEDTDEALQDESLWQAIYDHLKHYAQKLLGFIFNS